MITVRVPATSANVGCGYDCLGIAWDHWMTFTFEPIAEGVMWDRVADAYANEDNLIYRSFQAALARLGKSCSGVRIGIQDALPIARGLGSSAACVVGGILGAYGLTQTVVDKEVVLQLATQIEGHPDNVAPALFGSLQACCVANGQVYHAGYVVDPRYVFQILIPSFTLETAVARAAIPKRILHADAVYSASRLAVLIHAWQQYDLQMLRCCMDDRLHEPYRRGLIAEYEQVKRCCKTIDSQAFLISGSGPTLINVLEDASHAAAIEKRLMHLQHEWRSIVCRVNREGAMIW